MNDVSLLTPAMLADRWLCSSDLIYREINAGRLVASWIGGWKIEESEAERYYEANKKQPPLPRRKPGPKRKPRHLTKGV